MSISVPMQIAMLAHGCSTKVCTHLISCMLVKKDVFNKKSMIHTNSLMGFHGALGSVKNRIIVFGSVQSHSGLILLTGDTTV